MTTIMQEETQAMTVGRPVVAQDTAATVTFHIDLYQQSGTHRLPRARRAVYKNTNAIVLDLLDFGHLSDEKPRQVNRAQAVQL